MHAVGRGRSRRSIGTTGTTQTTVVDVAEVRTKFIGGTTEVVIAVLKTIGARQGAIAFVIAHARLQAHAAAVQRSAVELLGAIVSDGAIEPLVTLAHAAFANAAHGVTRGATEIAVANFLARLIGQALAKALLHLRRYDADLTAIGTFVMT